MAISPERPAHNHHGNKIKEFLKYPGKFFSISKQCASYPNYRYSVDHIMSGPGPVMVKRDNSCLKPSLMQTSTLCKCLFLSPTNDRKKSRDHNENTRISHYPFPFYKPLCASVICKGASCNCTAPSHPLLPLFKTQR